MNPGGEIRFINFHTHRGQGNPDTLAVVSLQAGEALPQERQENTFYSAGIHPWQVTGENLGILKAALAEVVSHPLTIMLGEAGFDRLRGGDATVQKEAFLYQAELAEQTRKPLVVHCVRGWQELEEARKAIRPSVPWIIHGFSGSVQLAASLVSKGYFLSLGSAGLKKETVAAAGERRIFVETDEKSIEINELYRRLAVITGMSDFETEKMIMDNFRELFNFRR